MGTNLYLQRKRDEQLKQEISELFTKNLNKFIEDGEWFDHPLEAFKDIHICKFSQGWKPCFKTNPHFYEENLYCVISFIEWAITKGDYELVDEYGEGYSISEFLEKVKDFNKEENYDLEKYYKEYSLESWGDYIDEYVDEDGLRWCEREFF